MTKAGLFGARSVRESVIVNLALDNWYGFLLFSFCVKLVSFYAKLYLAFSFLMTYLAFHLMLLICYLIGVCEIILGEFHHLSHYS